MKNQKNVLKKLLRTKNQRIKLKQQQKKQKKLPKMKKKIRKRKMGKTVRNSHLKNVI